MFKTLIFLVHNFWANCSPDKSLSVPPALAKADAWD